MMDFLEWYFCTPVTAHYRMCVLSGCVPRKILPSFTVRPSDCGRCSGVTLGLLLPWT
ncbi:hypothetical protein BGY98DRAFT_973304 [Russula aff. rugulosa BPL654]|nr:hypothetical protein BGY98DRAFT_973304 [Russula aff. rugulosa BPL654]